jgi:hypothetical protein
MLFESVANSRLPKNRIRNSELVHRARFPREAAYRDCGASRKQTQ